MHTEAGGDARASRGSGFHPVQGNGYAWWVCLVLGSGMFVSTLDRFVMSVVMVPIKKQFDLTDTHLALLAGLGFSLLYCVMSVPFGRLADLVNRRLMIASAILFWTLAAIGCAFSDSYGHLLSMRVAIGVGEAALVPAATSLLGAYFAKAQLGRAMGVYVTGSTLGKAAGFIGGGFLLAAFTAVGGWGLAHHHFSPWQMVFLITALPGVVVASLMLTIREPARPKVRKGGARLVDVWRQVARNPAAYVLFAVSWSCVYGVVHTFSTWSPSFYVRQFHLDIRQAALIGGMVGLIAGPIGNVLSGWVNDLMEKRGVKAAGSTLIGAVMILAFPAAALMTLSPSLPASIAGYFIASGLGVAGGPPGYAGIQRMAPPAHRGLLTSIMFAFASLMSQGVAPLVVGALSDTVFKAQGLGHAIFAATGLFALGGALAGFGARRAIDRAIAQADDNEAAGDVS